MNKKSVKRINAVHTGSEQDVYRDLVVQFMQEKEIKQTQFAEMLNVNPCHLNRWLHGKLEFGKNLITIVEGELFN